MSDFISPEAFAQLIDHTLLKADASADGVEALSREAIAHRFFGVCVNGCRVELAHSLVAEAGIKVVAVVGFPLGAMEADAKRFETEAAIDSGAHEIDVVLNIGKLKDGNTGYVARELRDVVESADERPVKVILETSLLSLSEKKLACEIAVDAGAAFVKTSTGILGTGATVEDVLLMRATVGAAIGVKASGGIRSLNQALALIDAGANRLGVSASVALLKELRAKTAHL